MALWTPSRITTALWLDASDAATLYDATSGGSLVAADGTVARWEDKSGNARHITQATMGKQPLYKLTVQNGVSGLSFDGSNDEMSLASDLALGTSHSIFFAVKNTATITAASAAQVILSGGAYVYPSTTTSRFGVWTGAVTSRVANERLSSLVSANGSGAEDTFGRAKTDTDISGAFFASTAFTTSGNAYRNRFRGSDDIATATVPGGFTSTNTRYPTLLRVVGAYVDSTTFWSGHILEIIVIAGFSSLTETETIEGYLAHKWGMTGDLPGGHPYKSVAPLASAGGSLINGQSLIRPADSKPYQQLIGV